MNTHGTQTTNGVVTPPPADEVLTVEETAALLRIPTDVLLTEATRGNVPGRRYGGEWRFSRRAVLDSLGTPYRPTVADWLRDHPPAPWTPEKEAEVEAEIAAIYAKRRADPVGGDGDEDEAE